MAVVKWTFEDPVTDDTYVFEVNPNEGGLPPRNKNVGSVNTTSPSGTRLLFEGQADMPIVSFSGVVLTREQYDALDEWFEKRYPIVYTDHLSRRFTVYVSRYEPKPAGKRRYPWRHTYTVSAYVLASEPAP